MAEGSLEVKLPTIWRDEKAVSREKSQKRKDQKEDSGARKGRKVAKHCVFFVVLMVYLLKMVIFHGYVK